MAKTLPGSPAPAVVRTAIGWLWLRRDSQVLSISWSPAPSSSLRSQEAGGTHGNEKSVLELQGRSSGLISSQRSIQRRLVFPLRTLVGSRVDGPLPGAHWLLSGVMPRPCGSYGLCAAGAASCSLVGLLCALASRTKLKSSACRILLCGKF